MKIKFINLLALLMLMLALSGGALAQTDANQDKEKEKEQQIRKLIQLTIGNDVGKQLISQLFGAMKKSFPKVPPDIWDQFEKEFDVNEFGEKIIPLYQKHFSDEDIEVLLKFYETPTGKKFLKELPEISREAFLLGQEYGKELAHRIKQRLQEKGYEPSSY